MIPWLNFLSLIPATTVTLLLISIAFLRFYNEQDFTFLGLIANPRTWSNRLTVAALAAAVANFGIEWDRRNRETDRLAEEAQRRATEEQRRIEEEQRRIEEEQRRVEEEQRRDEERQRRVDAERAEGDRRAAAEEQAARRAAVEIERDLAFLNYLLDPSAEHQRRLSQVIALLGEYRDTLV
jgi:superfamily II DNA helicase RecQ